MTVLYVAGARPGVGSTAVAASLAAAWRRRGRTVAADKPVAFAEGDADAELLAGAAASTGSGASLVASNGAVDPGLLDAAAKRVEGLAKTSDVVVIDGLPLTDGSERATEASGALARRLDAKVLGVLPYERSLTGESAAPWRDAFGDALIGLIVNRQTRYAAHDVSARLAPQLAAEGAPVVGVLLEERLLLAPTVRQVVDLLDATLYAGATGVGQLVEHFLIGGLITEWGGNYFNRLPNQAVIVRGGRADIQMAALNFPLNAMFLTGCSEPPQYVHQRAESLDVPLAVTARNTHETAEALEAIASRVTVHHPEKIESFSETLSERLDWDALEAAIGWPSRG